MEALSQASAEDLRGLAGWLASWSWPVDDQSFRGLIGSRHWTTLVEEPGESYVYDTGLVGSRPWATVTLIDAQVADFTVATTDVLPEDTSQGLAALRDAFADQVLLLEGLFGAPTDRSPGREPSASWTLPTGSRLAVRVGGGKCSWTLTSPEFVEIGRVLRGAGQ